MLIKNLTETSQSLGIKCEIFLPEDIYNGSYTNLAPDILFKLDDIAVSVSRRFYHDSYINSLNTYNHSGDHRMNGIFLAYGPDIKKGVNISGVKIYDIAPTILHMFDLSIPNDMDGKVLKQIFKEDSEFIKNEVEFEDYDKEKEILKKKIRNLKFNDKI